MANNPRNFDSKLIPSSSARRRKRTQPKVGITVNTSNIGNQADEEAGEIQLTKADDENVNIIRGQSADNCNYNIHKKWIKDWKQEQETFKERERRNLAFRRRQDVRQQMLLLLEQMRNLREDMVLHCESMQF